MHASCNTMLTLCHLLDVAKVRENNDSYLDFRKKKMDLEDEMYFFLFLGHPVKR